jgi:hypothetical protein
MRVLTVFLGNPACIRADDKIVTFLAVFDGNLISLAAGRVLQENKLVWPEHWRTQELNLGRANGECV